MLLEIIILFLSALFIYNWWAHGYWKRRNVFSIPKVFLFGNFWELVVNKMSLIFCDMYTKYKQHKMVGFYTLYKPMLFVSDPEIIRRVLVTDFNSFSDNGFIVYKEIDPISGFNPFSAKTIASWKELRSIQAANQTPLKLKEVVPNLTTRIGEFMYDYIKGQKDQPVQVLDLTTRAAVDSAVLHGFGIEPKSFTDPDYIFLQMATLENLFCATFVTMLSGFFFPLINRSFNLRMTSKEAEDFFLFMVETNNYHRQSTGTTRGDLFDTILKLNKKKLEQGNKAYSPLEISAHCATFFMDGTITSSAVLFFTLLELANNQDVQEKLRREIFSVGKKPEDFDFDKIHSITYLQMVFDESMRIHSPVTILSRVCTKDTVIEDVKISKGTKVFISPLAVHYDPEYYPDPEKFDPERFSEINKESRPKYTYLGFGEGPRICVGMKYANIFVKTSVVLILLKYKVLPTNGQKESFHDIEHFLLSPKPNVTVKFEEL